MSGLSGGAPPSFAGPAVSPDESADIVGRVGQPDFDGNLGVGCSVVGGLEDRVSELDRSGVVGRSGLPQSRFHPFLHRSEGARYGPLYPILRPVSYSCSANLYSVHFNGYARADGLNAAGLVTAWLARAAQGEETREMPEPRTMPGPHVEGEHT